MYRDPWYKDRVVQMFLSLLIFPPLFFYFFYKAIEENPS